VEVRQEQVIRNYRAAVQHLDLTSSQAKLLITNNAFCIVQRATAKSKTGTFRDFGVTEAPPGFQAGWSDCMYFFSLSLCSSCSLIWVFRVSFLYS
jgi:hypothetical protein